MNVVDDPGRCERFEQEALPDWEAGLPLDAHFESCEDCLEAQRSYEALRTALGELPVAEPRLDWKERVRRGIEDSPAASAPAPLARRTWIPQLLAAGLAALAVLWFFVPRLLDHPALPEIVSLEHQILSSNDSSRNALAPPVNVRFVGLSAAPFRELRLYRNESVLVARCQAQSSSQEAQDVVCEGDGEALRMEVELMAPGRYQSLFLASSEPMSEPGGSLDADSRDAIATGVVYELGDLIEIF